MKWILFYLLASIALCAKPNIVFIIMDDMGWSDVGFRTGNKIKTPNMEEIKENGVDLEQYYSQDVCSPTRASIITGKYPSRMGLQHYVILPSHSHGVPTNETTLPYLLKKEGYATHAIGKWHMGFWKWEYTPTFRGFDDFYGFYNGGANSYYTHMLNNGYDMRNDKEPNCGKGCSEVDKSVSGEYTTSLFTRKAVDVINKHDTSKPLYMYVAYQAVHDPAHVPQRYVDMYKETIENQKRRVFAGMVTCADEGIGNITQALKNKGLANNTYIIMVSDNGGPIYEPKCDMCGDNAGAINYPLRGGKHSLYEGGVRTVGLVSGPTLPKAHTYKGLMHSSDWFPTILEMAGATIPDLKLDSMSHLKSIQGKASFPREEIILNLDHIHANGQQAGIRYKEWKLLIGPAGCPFGWQKEDYSNEEGTGLDKKATSDLQRQYLREMNISEDSTIQLYNIEIDPNERKEISEENPPIVESLMKRLVVYYKERYVYPYTPYDDPEANPDKHDGVWEPWGSDEL